MVIVMVSMLLTIVLGLTSIIIGGANVAQSLSYSVKAFHAADTGIEKALYNAKNGVCSNVSGNFNSDSTYSYAVTISYTGASCLESGTNMKSLGQYRTINRKIEVSY